MNVSKKGNYLLRKYDFAIQEYAKAIPKWDELAFFECLLEKLFEKQFPQEGALTVRFWGEGDQGGGDFFKPISNITLV